MEEVDLPTDLPCVALPVFWRPPAPAENGNTLLPFLPEPELCDLGGGWIGYADGAAFNLAHNVTAEAWFEQHDRDARCDACRARHQHEWWYQRGRG